LSQEGKTDALLSQEGKTEALLSQEGKTFILGECLLPSFFKGMGEWLP
jgi:hypothetical protein